MSERVRDKREERDLSDARSSHGSYRAPYSRRLVWHTAVPLPSALWRVYDLDSHERISNIEELELPEICIGNV